MPQKDKTGPMGAGPMTGRGMGRCADSSGSGLGRGRGYGRTMCGWFYRKYRNMSENDKKELLKEEISDLKEELQMVEKELGELEK